MVEHKGTFALPAHRYELVGQTVVEDNLVSTIIKAQDGIKGNEVIRDLIDLTEVHSFREKLPTMADIFISLVKGEGDEALKNIY